MMEQSKINMIQDMINEEISNRGLITKDGKIVFAINNLTVSFPIDKNKPAWKILNESYPYMYRALEDAIFDELHPY